MNPSMTARDAIGVLAQRALLRAHPQPANPDAWLAATTKDLRGRLWGDAYAIASDQPDLSAEAIADLLHPGSTVTSEPRRPELDAWEPPPPVPHDIAKARARRGLALARAALRGELDPDQIGAER